jgi:hypothetical protein
MELAVGLEERRRIEMRGQLADSVEPNLVHAEVPRATDGLKERQSAQCGRVLDRHDIEEPVARIGVRGDDEAAAEAATVGNGEQEHRPRAAAVACVARQRTVLENLAQGRDPIAQHAAVGRSAKRVDDRGIEAHSGDVEHVLAIDCRAVQLLIGSLGGESRHGDPGAGRSGDAGDEVVAGAAGEQSDATPRARVRGDDRSRRLAPGPVAAEDGNRVGTAVEGTLDAARLVAGSAGDERLPYANAIERAPNGGEEPGRPAAAGRRIRDQPDGALHEGT